MIQPLTLQDELNAIAHGDNNDLGGRGMSGNDEVISEFLLGSRGSIGRELTTKQTTGT